MHALGRKPDLVLLDINMPGTDGLTFCRQIRRFYQSPILFLTARGTDQDQIQGLRMGGDDYIMKPFHLDVLAQKVKTHPVSYTHLAKAIVKKFGKGEARE